MEIEEIFQESLFNDCSSGCDAYAACGGRRATAPCGCVWSVDTGLRYQCQKCYIICRERGRLDQKAKSKSFAAEIESGQTLDQVQIRQVQQDIPVFIPTYTHHKHCREETFSEFAAVDIRILLNCSKIKGATVNHKFTSPDVLRKYLNVAPDCQLIAVLNGQDWMLESFWAASRVQILARLKDLGFSICTGPTFSLTEFTTKGTRVPYSHHTAMLMRHHQVISEIDFSGLSAVPNLYWLDGDNREILRWSKWLQDNPDVHMISKDFTSTRAWSSIEPRLKEFLFLLEKTGRIFHIMIIGSGPQNALKIMRQLKECGHTVAIVTSAPIMKAIHGHKYFIDGDGKFGFGPETDSSFPMLVKSNLAIFYNELKKCRA